MYFFLAGLVTALAASLFVWWRRRTLTTWKVASSVVVLLIGIAASILIGHLTTDHRPTRRPDSGHLELGDPNVGIMEYEYRVGRDGIYYAVLLPPDFTQLECYSGMVDHSTKEGKIHVTARYSVSNSADCHPGGRTTAGSLIP